MARVNTPTDFELEGNVVDVISRRIYPGKILISNGRIKKITPSGQSALSTFILPGLVDAHVHIESSMLVPSEFARLAVIHGTVATVSDPHEIANVMGAEGISYMIDNGNKVPFHFNFGASSCVPATTFETAGATIDALGVENLLKRNDIRYLSEMMNYPGVLHHEPEVMKKIDAAKRLNKPIDGHAPGLIGQDAIDYIAGGGDFFHYNNSGIPNNSKVIISTDHECFSYEEALFKIRQGMKVIIREGSAAKNFDALIALLNDFPDRIMFCSDDKHPDDLVRGHINQFITRSLILGIDFWKAIRAATYNPIIHYGLECGLLREGDSADLIIVDDLDSFHILKTFVKGILAAENGQSFIHRTDAAVINHFNCREKSPEEFVVKPAGDKVRVIEALNGQIITKERIENIRTGGEDVIPDIENDILKFSVINRYFDARPAVAFIKNFGLKQGAIASCVGHDSHNILAVGTSNEMICRAVNLVIRSKGGLAAVSANEELVLPLPVGGILTNSDAYQVAKDYEKIDQLAKKLGSHLSAPYMTLSFMALPVIPELKLTDKGLFDVRKFEFTSLFVDG